MNKQRVRTNKVGTPHLLAEPHQCIACWKCIEACPKQVFGKIAILWHKHIKIMQPESCIGCKKCISVCPRNVFTTIPTNETI